LLNISHKSYLFYGLIVFSLLFFSYFCAQGLQEIYNLQKEKEKIELNNQKLREENMRLANQIKKIKNNDREEIEKIVREELGLIKKGEIVYKFVE
jgi:cell division protein FtsB